MIRYAFNGRESLNPYNPYMNHVRDYDKLQGYSHFTDSHIQIPRDINHRRVTIENSSINRCIGVAITTYLTGPCPKIRFILKPGEVKSVALNTVTMTPQAIWLLNAETGAAIGKPSCITRMSNQLVIRDGINLAWVDFFRTPSISA